jgi:hypothetical protein
MVIDKDELLARQCEHTGGTKVVNCVQHMNLPLTERPTHCQLCSADVQNRLATAIKVNAWLNQWKDDATELLRVFKSLSVEP